MNAQQIEYLRQLGLHNAARIFQQEANRTEGELEVNGLADQWDKWGLHHAARALRQELESRQKGA